jgi:hypothetical protein
MLAGSDDSPASSGGRGPRDSASSWSAEDGALAPVVFDREASTGMTSVTSSRSTSSAAIRFTPAKHTSSRNTGSWPSGAVLSGPVRRHQTSCGLTAAPKRSRSHIGIMHVINKQSRTFAVVARGPVEEHNEDVLRVEVGQYRGAVANRFANSGSGFRWTAVDETVGRAMRLSTDRTSWDRCGLRP